MIKLRIFYISALLWYVVSMQCIAQSEIRITETFTDTPANIVFKRLSDKYKIPYVFSGPVIMGMSLNKHLAKLVVAAAGVPVSPGFLITDIKDSERCKLEYPLFVKPVSEGTGKGITAKSLVNSPEELKIMVKWILSEFRQPALVEEYLPGREFTVGIVGYGDEATVIGGMK